MLNDEIRALREVAIDCLQNSAFFGKDEEPEKFRAESRSQSWELRRRLIDSAVQKVSATDNKNVFDAKVEQIEHAADVGKSLIVLKNSVLGPER